MEYRREIDGLRALAVIPIILFHAGFKYFSGGFIGVDVFFVISGYLITSIIIAEQQTGTFSLIRFYERRARRILPALFTMMLCCLPFAWLWLMPDDLKKFSQSVADVSIFISNITFLNQTGYFDTAAELKPLLHTWSLAVEEQYYLLFPIFLITTAKFTKNWTVRIIAAVALISLLGAHWGAYNKPAGTFFLLPTRIWELLIGALTAFYVSSNGKVNQSRLINQTTSLLGFSLIVFAIFNFDRQTPFPSLYALIPTVGTALIILFANHETLVGKLLGSKVFVGIGLISYSAYLWHQPIFAFVRYRCLSEPSKTLLVVLVIATLSVAYLCWKYIETPFRHSQHIKCRQIFLSGALCSAIFIAIGLVGQLNGGWTQRFTIPPEVLKSLEMSNIRVACDKNYDGKGWGVDLCPIGDTGRIPSVAVFGDSHAESLLPAFDTLGKKLGISVIHLGLGGCPSLSEIDVLNGYFELGVCKQLAERQYEYVKANRIKKVFLATRWTLYVDGGGYDGKGFYYLGINKLDQRDKTSSRLLFEESFKKTIKAYRDTGAEVYVIAQVPLQIVFAKQMYYRMYSESLGTQQKDSLIKKMSLPRAQHNELQKYTRSVFLNTVELEKENIIIFDDVFCDADKCLIGSPETSYYHDHDHLSGAGAHLVNDQLMKYMAN